MVEYSANVSRKEDSIHKQNDLLLWSALEWATDSGNFKVFSMAGSHFYLSKFGGIHKSTYEYKKDITTLKFHRISDNIKRSIFNIYRSLPIGLRNFLKNIAQR